ncbi:MAG: polysaccharide pyruvyl transferase CsaB [Ruminococcaceae bacterium]|nr:polysaccharide pyruvyl transferase CsaB [Oscillospiraceae bacterium]
MADITSKKILMTLMRLEIGGAETHVLELSLELARRGFQVVVASGGGVYEEHLKKAGIKHYKVPMYTKSPAKMLRSFLALRRIIKDEQIDIVHAHGRIPAFLCGLLHPFMKFTFVTTAHWVFRTSGGLKYLSNWGEKVMAVSEDIKTYLMDNYGTNPADIYVTINGIDTGRFSPEADFSKALSEFSLQKDSKKIVYISRMDEDRALVAFHLVQIAPEIEKRVPGTEIVIVGGGNVFDKLKKEADAVNEQVGRKLITLTGGRTDIDAFCAMSNLFIGVSRSALEAMACAKPVIVAGNEGYLGIFDENKLQVGIDTNFCCRGLVLSTPELLLEDVMSVLSADEAQLLRWGNYGRQVICDYYSVSKMALDCVEMYCAAAEQKRWDAVISGYYGYGNAGDEALLSAMIQHLREEKPDIRILVLSKHPTETEREHGVYALNRYRLCKIRKNLKKSKLFISGGGSLLQDVTSSKSLWYYLYLIRMAQRTKTPVMLYANGIGPIVRRKNRQHAARILEGVTAITLREPESCRELAELGIPEGRALVTADPALSLVPASAAEVEALLSTLGLRNDTPLLGVSLRPWRGLTDERLQEIADVISEICAAYGLVPVLIPMKYPEDLDISYRLKELIPGQSVILTKPCTAEETIGLVAHTRAMLAMRLHSLIYAAAVTVPTVGLSYDPKVDAFMHYIGAGEAVSLENFSAQQLKAALLGGLETDEESKRALTEKMAALKELSRKNAQQACDIIRKSEGSYTYEVNGN